jgi:hypothetical protein
MAKKTAAISISYWQLLADISYPLDGLTCLLFADTP